jgi:hypothetical protein
MVNVELLDAKSSFYVARGDMIPFKEFSFSPELLPWANNKLFNTYI